MNTSTWLVFWIVGSGRGGAFGWDEQPADTLTPIEQAHLEAEAGTAGAPAPHVFEDADAGLAFDHSTWGCCYTSICEWLMDTKCLPDELAISNGPTSCCVPDTGQCDDGADAGVL